MIKKTGIHSSHFAPLYIKVDGSAANAAPAIAACIRIFGLTPFMLIQASPRYARTSVRASTPIRRSHCGTFKVNTSGIKRSDSRISTHISRLCIGSTTRSKISCLTYFASLPTQEIRAFCTDIFGRLIASHANDCAHGLYLMGVRKTHKKAYFNYNAKNVKRKIKKTKNSL